MKYVLLGTGNISNTYLQAMKKLPNSEIIACVSRSGNRPKDKPGLPSFPNLDAIPADYDAIIICTPNGLHCAGILEAAKRDKHVLTEKPLGIEMDTMAEAIYSCEQAGLTLAVAYQRRTAPDNQAIKKLLEKSALGKVFAADLSCKFYRDQAYYDSGDYRGGYAIDGGGPFMQQACHNLDLYVWFFGLPKRLVSMMDTFTHRMEAEDHGAALLRYENGMIGTLIASTATQPGYAARLEVHTNQGSFTMTDDVISDWQFEGIPNPSNTDFQYTHDGATSASVSDSSAHEAILRDFEEAVATGRKPLVDGHSAKATTELILKIYGAVV